MTVRTRFLVLPLFVAAFAAATAGAALAKPIVWRDWDSGLRQAGESNRPVLVDVYTDWCGWCKRMDADVYSKPAVRDYLSQHFVLVRLNAESAASARYQGETTTMQNLASRFRVTGYPTTIFLKSGGDHIANVPGYVPADRFLLLLHYIGEGQLDRGVSFDDYVKQQGGDGGDSQGQQ